MLRDFESPLVLLWRSLNTIEDHRKEKLDKKSVEILMSDGNFFSLLGEFAHIIEADPIERGCFLFLDQRIGRKSGLDKNMLRFVSCITGDTLLVVIPNSPVYNDVVENLSKYKDEFDDLLRLRKYGKTTEKEIKNNEFDVGYFLNELFPEDLKNKIAKASEFFRDNYGEFFDRFSKDIKPEEDYESDK